MSLPPTVAPPFCSPLAPCNAFRTGYRAPPTPGSREDRVPAPQGGSHQHLGSQPPLQRRPSLACLLPSLSAARARWAAIGSGPPSLRPTPPCFSPPLTSRARQPAPWPDPTFHQNQAGSSIVWASSKAPASGRRCAGAAPAAGGARRRWCPPGRPAPQQPGWCAWTLRLPGSEAPHTPPPCLQRPGTLPPAKRWAVSRLARLRILLCRQTGLRACTECLPPHTLHRQSLSRAWEPSIMRTCSLICEHGYVEAATSCAAAGSRLGYAACSVCHDLLQTSQHSTLSGMVQPPDEHMYADADPAQMLHQPSAAA